MRGLDSRSCAPGRCIRVPHRAEEEAGMVDEGNGPELDFHHRVQNPSEIRASTLAPLVCRPGQAWQAACKKRQCGEV